VTETDEQLAGGGAARRRRNRRLAVATLLCVATALVTSAAAFALTRGESTSKAPPITVAIGDVVKVSGAPIGCVARREGGERALDCRRIGPLTGTYGTILTGHRVLVIRFLSAKTAKVVFTARHRQLRTHTCS
jgi:hypothetical protein